MFVFILSSRKPWQRASPRDLSTRLFCVWFCTKHLCFAFERHGRACRPSPPITGHGLRPPAVFCGHRPNVWPASTIDGRPAIFFGYLHFWPADYYASAFADIFSQLACIWLPSIHVCGGISLFRSLSCKLYKTKSSIKERVFSLVRGWTKRLDILDSHFFRV